jgi:1-deoxy-D-xylulose 5-phosphate reductoisomerase
MIKATKQLIEQIEKNGGKIIPITAEHLKTIRKFIPTEKPQK